MFYFLVYFQSISHEVENLNCPNLKFIGLNIKDLSQLKLKSDQFSLLSENDRNKARNLLNKNHIQLFEPEIVEQVKKNQLYYLKIQFSSFIASIYA